MHADPAREVYVQASRKSYVTQSACVAVLKSVRKHGLPKHISRPTMKRTRVDALPHESPCGSLFSSMRLTCIDGGFLQVPVVMPWPQLYGILESSPEFADFVHESLGIANRAELGIAIYCDEILPGNALRHSNERKLLAFYWSLTNFRGQMTREEAWFHICVIRSNRVKLVKDGYTQVFKQLMSLFFESPHDIRLGVPLNFPARGLQKMFCGRISMIVEDEAALKQIWSVKGSAGTMMCMLCRNVVASVSDLDSHASGSLLPSCVTTLAGVVAHTDGSIQANAQFLASQKPIVSKPPSIVWSRDWASALPPMAHCGALIVMTTCLAVQRLQRASIGCIVSSWLACGLQKQDFCASICRKVLRFIISMSFHAHFKAQQVMYMCPGATLSARPRPESTSRLTLPK